MTTPEQLAETVREALDAGLRNVYSIERSIEGKAALDSLLAAHEEMRRERLADVAVIHREQEARRAAEREVEEMRQQRIAIYDDFQREWGRRIELVKEVGTAEREVERLRELVARFRQWDMLDVAGDGPYWKRTIDAALGSESE